MLHQTLPILGQLWQLFEVSQILEFLRYYLISLPEIANFSTKYFILSKVYTSGINRIYHLSPMQIEKSQPEGEQIMPKTRFTQFPAFPIDLKVGVSRSASETNVRLFFLPMTLRIVMYHSLLLLFRLFYTAKNRTNSVYDIGKRK